jgi:uncharacterized membrane protein
MTAETNPNSRLEAFCDGVFAIALTLLVIDLKIPSMGDIKTTADLWLALERLLPTLSAFLMSFVVIFITWVNHHAALKLIDKSSPHLLYANGFLLLCIVFIPFPTALLGEYILTDRASPAVALYSLVLALTAVGWNLTGRAALSKTRPLAKNATSELAIRDAYKKSAYGFFLYLACGIAAIWFPLVVAIIIAITWLFWLFLGVTLKQE